MEPLRYRVAVIVGLSFATPVLAAADPILLTASRSVSVSLRTPDGGGVSDAARDADVLDRSLLNGPHAHAVAQLRTDLSNPRHIVASGSTFAAPTDRHRADAQVNLNLFFVLRAPQPFDLTLDVTGSMDDGDPFTRFAGLELRLRDEFTLDYDAVFAILLSPGSRRLRGVLPIVLPDDDGLMHYRLSLRSNSSVAPGYVPASTEFRLIFNLEPESAPVPEPGSIVLLSTGLVAAAAQLRRRRRL